MCYSASSNTVSSITMDSSEETKEVTFRRHGTADLDLVLDDVSEATTVKMAIDGQLANQSAETSNPKLERNEESLYAMLQYLTDEVKSLKMRVDPKPESHSELDLLGLCAAQAALSSMS